MTMQLGDEKYVHNFSVWNKKNLGGDKSGSRSKCKAFSAGKKKENMANLSRALHNSTARNWCNPSWKKYEGKLDCFATEEA